MYQALYRKWRPQSFSDVVGQSAVTDTLTKQVETGRLAHAYLFSGSRGTGKTTCAKILAKAVNCENPFHGNPCNKCPSCLGITSGEILDVIELDAASNNGVDYVREIREEAVYSPATVKKRVYIIDEVHMFSTNAFNALLKIMEEPPEHVMFILATTELHKVPATIASRCQKFVFKRIPTEVIADRVMFVSRSEGAETTPEAANYIAALSDGAMRDALSLLDQCISLSDGALTAETVDNAVGLAGKTQMFEFLSAVADRNLGDALSALDVIYKSGRNITSVLNEAAEILRDILIIKTAGDKLARVNSRYTDSDLAPITDKFGNMRLVRAIETINRSTSALESSANKRIDAEMCCVRLCEGDSSENIDGVISRIEKLEDAVKNGVVKREEKPLKAESSPKEQPAKEKIVPPWEDAPKKQEEKPAKSPARSEAPSDAGSLWGKILSSAKSKLSPGVAPLFTSVRASLDGNMLTLTSDNGFVMKMLTQKANLDILREAAKSVSESIILTAREAGREEKKDTAGLDELLAGIEDKSNVIIK